MTRQSPELLEALRRAGPDLLTLAAWRSAWLAKARQKQIPKFALGILYELFLAGRGWGKTETGAQWLGYEAAKAPKTRWAVVAPTQADVKGVCFMGVSGLLSVIPRSLIAKQNLNDLEIHLKNGSIIEGFSAEKPDRLRGPQFHGAWCDEFASWGRLTDTWMNLQMGTRLGANPRTVITTTPRPLDELKKLIANVRVHTTTGSTKENEANLAPAAVQMLYDVYSGTRIGDQELAGLIVDVVEGALWTRSQLDALRSHAHNMEFVRVVVAIDPAVTANKDSDETGIIVAGIDLDGIAHVLHDASGRHAPDKWAKIALFLYDRYGADAIVAETNNGGDLVEMTLQAFAGDRNFNYKGIHAKRGKYLRAEPVAALYKKSRVKHAGSFPALEKQMCEWTGTNPLKSPDRLDACVYAITELTLGAPQHAFL